MATLTNVFKPNLPALKGGSRVLIARRSVPSNWAPQWTPEMTKSVGKMGTIINVNTRDGYQVQLDNEPGTYSFWYPDTALKFTTVEEDMARTNAAPSSSQIAGSGKKKRVRVPKDGPWNAAPCTHLRWNLMGFFREKLAIVKTKVSVMLVDGSTAEVDVTQIEVACTKCNTRMMLQAKG